MALITQQVEPQKPDLSPQITGLTHQQVKERTQRGQTNAFEARVGRTYWQILRYNVFNLFNMVLFVLLLIVLLSQDYLTVLFAGFSVLTNSLSGSIQEIQAKRKLNKLAALAAHKAKVLREGAMLEIPNQQIVKDDVLFIYPGDKLPVDGLVIQGDGLEMDESQLTGESDAIHKAVGDAVSSGSFCVSGSGLMLATRVGQATTVNRLTSIAKVYKHVLTPTQQKLNAIVEISLLAFAILGPVVFISQYLQGHGFFDVIRSTIVFTTSLVPQGLILVSILSLTLGAVKISQKKTLVQRINAVESLANVSVLCFDKTGTLTKNQLSVVDVLPLGEQSPDEVEAALLKYTANMAYRNSTAQAIAEYFPREVLIAQPEQKEAEIPFSSVRKWGAMVFPDEMLILGAPERILGQNPRINDQMRQFTEQGLRLVALARSHQHDPDKNALSLANGLLEDSGHLIPLALILISDQMREDIQETLADFKAQQVKLKVISGDNLQTVKAIAAQAGMKTDLAYTGDELKNLSDYEFDQAVNQADVFARVEPETKRRIIQSLQKHGEYVAMVGDGVNDVPALKEAHLAIVMNNGAQISKDIADIVLLNNAMSTLPLAFREGREITQTLFGSTKIFLAKNVYHILGFVIILLMTLPFPTTPIQISWAAFGTNNIPGGLLAFGLLRPKFIRNFRDDVIDFVLTMGFIGGVGFALLFLVAHQYSDLDTARHTVTLFFLFYGTVILWHMIGVDILKPRSILQHWKGFLVPLLLILPVVGLATAFPHIFDFGWPPAWLILLTLTIISLCLLCTNIGMKNRHLLHTFYSLFQR